MSKKRFISQKKALKRVQNSEIRRARRRQGEDQEAVWKKFVMAAWLSLGCFLVSGMFAAAATGVRSAQYYRQIETAAGTGNLWERAAGFREAVQVMPLETEAYETFAEDIARDSVITAEESEAFCSLFYANDCMNRLREWKPGSYAKLQIKAGKLFWTYGGDEREAIRQFWANAAAVRGASGHDRRNPWRRHFAEETETSRRLSVPRLQGKQPYALTGMRRRALMKRRSGR